jgi:16S rRNA (adenine1518-N6/adenine1519-N6)-dimethyltransferase
VVAGLLAEFNLHPRKRFGQNFLVDEHVLERIVAAAELTPADTVLEIGPGLGTLTAALAAQAGQVVAVELDRELLPVLESTVGSLPNVRILQGDILQLPLDQVLPPGNAPYKVVANLPYYVTSPVLLKFLLADRPWARLVFMVQREVAERLAASPGSKAYGSLSVVLRFSAEPAIMARVPRTAFFPPPEVDSAVVALSPRPAPLPSGPERETFFRVVRGAFGQRRKKLSNALAGAGFPPGAVAAALAEADVDGGRRGETLDLSEFVALAVSLSAQMLALLGN